MAKFMLLLRGDVTADYSKYTPQDFEQILGEYAAWGERMASENRLLGSDKLTDEGGMVILAKDGKGGDVQDGPYVESKEVVGRLLRDRGRRLPARREAVRRGTRTSASAASRSVRSMRWSARRAEPSAMTAPGLPPDLVDNLFRQEYARMVSGLCRVLGPERLELVEDVVQEALLRALRVWPAEGIPDRPEAWLFRVARNLAFDSLKRQRIVDRVGDELARWAEAETLATAPAPPEPEAFDDDTLRMLFLCAHPAVPADARIPLILKNVCGFGVPAIARALLKKEATIAQRLVRAKARLQGSEASFAIPSPARAAGANRDGAPGAVSDVQRGLPRARRRGAGPQRRHRRGRPTLRALDRTPRHRQPWSPRVARP